ncbi:hypothetical protein [Sutcliffiella cohnii]|uniref:hypothetical protein n=1 Tax=Sutcliffiella cohnii TaxID=33932 RepID=UPI002E2213C3|nr:hypothetical protein [Sutcliffiella cohnii]
MYIKELIEERLRRLDKSVEWVIEERNSHEEGLKNAKERLVQLADERRELMAHLVSLEEGNKCLTNRIKDLNEVANNILYPKEVQK